MKIIVTLIRKYSYEFIPVLFSRRNQKQGTNFQLVGGPITSNISVFCLKRSVLYFKDMLNLKGFYIEIFSNVIPVRTIV